MMALLYLYNLPGVSVWFNHPVRTLTMFVEGEPPAPPPPPSPPPTPPTRCRTFVEVMGVTMPQDYDAKPGEACPDVVPLDLQGNNMLVSCTPSVAHLEYQLCISNSELNLTLSLNKKP